MCILLLLKQVFSQQPQKLTCTPARAVRHAFNLLMAATPDRACPVWLQRVVRRPSQNVPEVLWASHLGRRALHWDALERGLPHRNGREHQLACEHSWRFRGSVQVQLHFPARLLPAGRKVCQGSHGRRHRQRIHHLCLRRLCRAHQARAPHGDLLPRSRLLPSALHPPHHLRQRPLLEEPSRQGCGTGGCVQGFLHGPGIHYLH
mmetsp:Transcript_58500/g.154281  ORF Transcript_58500/g.154281 Transcript_58500/m.154281 type:complete len:204 (+) Transcript_58500:141-752(+)